MSTMWERTARRIEADSLDDLAGHRRLQSEEGQAFLQALRNHHNERTDALMPWLAREFRKGRLQHDFEGTAGGGLFYDPDPTDSPHRLSWDPLESRDLNHWADWYHQPDRRKVPLEQLYIHQLHGEVAAYEQQKAKRMQDEEVEEGRHQGEVVHSWPDGWNVRRLIPGKNLDFEAWHMRGDPTGPHDHGAPICVNWPQYQRGVAEGRNLIYSLRDPQGKPHVTTEIEPRQFEPHPFDISEAIQRNQVTRALPAEYQQQVVDYANRPDIAGLDDEGIRQRWLHHDEGLPEGQNPDWPIGTLFELHRDHTRRRGEPIPHGGEIVQIQGKGNSIPKDEYQARMRDWFQTFPEETRPDWHDAGPEMLTDPAQVLPEDHPLRREQENQWADQDLGGYGSHGNYGLRSEVEQPMSNYSALVDKLTDPEWYKAAGRFGDVDPDRDPEELARALYDHALKRGEIPGLAHALFTEKVPRGNWAEQGHSQTRWDRVMDDLNDHRDQNLDYYPAYPGEEWDPTDAHWLPEEEWQNARDAYDESEREMQQNVPSYQAASHLTGLLTPHNHPETGEWSNEPVRPATFSRVASERPFRQLWAFSPQSARAHFFNEADHHPAEVPTHDSIASDLGETGLYHGYAYSIPGGWRVLDYHHKPVADPFVLRHVVEGLRKQDRPIEF